MLIVDDVPIARDIIKMLIKKFNINIEVVGEAGNGEEAVAKYKELKPDIVILDIAMHKMNGIEALKAIKAHNPRAAVVIISAMGEQEYVVDEALEAGARAVLPKPIQSNQFAGTIKRLIES
jgi:two-component system chemotaxis response regulator CheY